MTKQRIHYNLRQPYHFFISREQREAIIAKGNCETPCGLRYNVFTGGFTTRWSEVTCESCRKAILAVKKAGRYSTIGDTMTAIQEVRARARI